jgi:hypothetical protein
VVRNFSKQADEATYVAKSEGKNRVRCYQVPADRSMDYVVGGH